jgi:DNA-directed RNA polymerase sigma subunit (sigma70/sigma32)
MRAGIDDREHTFQEIGDELGVGMQRAREIHARAFRRMRYGPRLEAAGVDRNIIGLEE